jgi:cytochrome c
MNSFEMNKVLGAVLGCCLGVVALNIASGAIFAPTRPAKPGYEIKIPERKGPATQQQQQPQQDQPIEPLLASADSGRGESSAQKCAGCHTFTKGGPSGLGPNLWGVVGRPKASTANFNYSAALKAKGGEWTIDDLNHFLASPKDMVPGTAMTFAGLPRAAERADVIVYLNSLADSPKPLPKAAQAPEQK